MFSKPIKVNQTMSRNHGLHLTVRMLKSVTRSHSRSILAQILQSLKLLLELSLIMEQHFLNKQMTYGNTTKPFFINDYGYRTYFKPCVGNTIDTQRKVLYMLFCKLKLHCVSFLVVLFNLINLIVAYP